MRLHQKKVWTCAILAVFILFFYTFSFAQTESIKGVQFKDGSIIYGRVVEMNIYNIRIETKDGKIISREFNDVVNFIKDTGVDAKLEVKQAPVAEKILQAEMRGVRFKDGSVIYGTIIEMNINNVIILTKDNEVITRKFDDFASFIKSELHTWEIGPEISFIEYNEPDLMKEKGMMIGIGAAYIYHNGVMIKFAGRYSYGLVDYQNSGTINNIDDIIFEIKGLAGYDVRASNTVTITPFIGLGYRYLEDDASGKISSTGAGGYLRESNYYYSPIGIEVVNVIDGDWSAGVMLEYDYFWKGKQKSYLSNVDSGYNTVESKQNSGYGVKGSINIKKQTNRVFYVIEPFIRYWNIDKSDVQNLTYYGTVIGTGWEPKNESTEIGVKFMIGF
jgi:hypothetical protein